MMEIDFTMEQHIQLQQHLHDQQQIMSRPSSRTLQTCIKMQHIDTVDQSSPDVHVPLQLPTLHEQRYNNNAVEIVSHDVAGLQFVDLSYQVMKKHKKDSRTCVSKQVSLLRGISGHACKRQLTAVLGPSGAGKSTLLDALAGRIAKGSLGGTVTVDGRQISASRMKKISSYVMQDDQLFPMLTVYETFMFAAEVRLPPSMKKEEKTNRVESLLEKLGLKTAAHTYIGEEGKRGISGGERRRVSIGVDIIHDPALLFLDEPTSGLDSTSAYSVVEKLSDIARSGSTVLLTIHQPSTRIQTLLDQMIILARGSLVYAGSPVGLSRYLETFGRRIPEGENPLEYFLDVIKEYDQSTLGLDPLVQFQRYGTKPTTEMKTPQPRTPAYRTTLQGSGTPAQMMNYHARFGTSQRNHQQAGAGTPQMNHQGGQTPHQLDRIHEESVEEAWTRTDLELEEEEFDASLVRSTPMNNFGNPKLASQFYKNFSVWLYTEAVESVWRTPARSAWPLTTPGRTPGRTPARTPGRTPGKTPGRTPARIPGRFPSMIGTSTFAKVPLPIVVSPSPSTVQFADAMQTLECMPDSSHNFTTSSLYDSELCDDDFLEPKFANPWRRELQILMWRNVKNVIRTPELFLSREIVFVVMSTMLSSLFKHLDAQNDITIAYNLLNFYIFAVCLLFFSSNDAVPSFIQERFIFIRETSHNAYRASSYVMSSFLVYLPFFAVQAATFAILTFFPMKLNGSVIILWIVLFASLLTSNSFVMFVSAVVPNYITGYAVVIASTALFFLQCGFFLKRTQIPIEWKWLHFMSIIKYPFEGLLINQFNSDLGFCYSAVQDPTPGPVGKVVQDPGFNKRPSGCYTGGPDILYSMDILNSKDFNQDKILISVLILLAWGALYRLLFYVILRFYSKNLRK